MTTAGPGTLGLPERTGRELDALAARLGPARAVALVEAIRRTGEVEPVTRGLLRIQEALLAAPGAEVLATCLVLASESIQRLLQRRPGLLRWVHRSASTGSPLEAAALAAPLAALLRRAGNDAPEELLRRLRRFKARQALRLAARDLWLGMPMEALGREQTALAEALLQAALPLLEGPLRRRYGAPSPEGFVVLGLGKLGGEDLNWSSDIDLVLVHRGDGTTEGGTAGSVPTVTYYTRLAEALARTLVHRHRGRLLLPRGPQPPPPGAGGRRGELAPVDAASTTSSRGAPGSGPPGSRPGRWPETSPWDRSCSRRSGPSSGGGRSTSQRWRRSAISRRRSTCGAPPARTT